VLFITQHWSCYEWVSEHITKVLFVPEESLKQMEESNPDAKTHFKHIETFKKLNSGLVELKALQLHAVYHFTHVVCLSEDNLIRGAKIREMLGITFGQTVEQALHYRDKILMKKLLIEKGIRVPNFASVEHASDIVQFVENNGLPVVIKPRKGYLSLNTTIIFNEQELEKFLGSDFNTKSGYDTALDLEIEEYIDGEMYHVDGIVYDNEVKSCWPSKYMNKCVDFNESKFLSSYSLIQSNPLVRRIQEYVVNVIKTLGGPPCFPFHGEVWVTKTDEIVFCEIASRTGGAGVRHQLRELFGLRTDKTWTQHQCQDTITNPELGSPWNERLPQVPYSVSWLVIYPQLGKLSKIPLECPLPYVIGWNVYGSVGEIFHSRENCVDAVVSAVITGTKEDEVQTNVLNVFEWFTQNTVYEPL